VVPLDRRKRFFSSLNRPDRFWGPSSSSYWGSFPTFERLRNEVDHSTASSPEVKGKSKILPVTGHEGPEEGGRGLSPFLL